MTLLETQQPYLLLEIVRAHHGLRRALVGRRRRHVKAGDGVVVLACLDATEWRCGADVRKRLRFSPMVFSQHLRALRKRRLVLVGRNLDDPRFNYLQLTPRGARARALIARREAALLDELARVWGRPRVDHFLTNLRLLLVAPIPQAACVSRAGLTVPTRAEDVSCA